MDDLNDKKQKIIENLLSMSQQKLELDQQFDWITDQLEGLNHQLVFSFAQLHAVEMELKLHKLHLKVIDGDKT